MIPRALTIAGSDSSGGAGIQADLKTFTVFGVYGMTAITAITAQNTRRVEDVWIVPPAFVAAQIRAVVEDVGAAPTKTGMLGTAATIDTVADLVRRYCLSPLVVDPVMVAQTGASLLEADAIGALRTRLLPLASLITPNVPEAERLLGMTIRSVSDMRHAARALIEAGAQACLLKGGHLHGEEAIDILDTGTKQVVLAVPRVSTPHTHGTGCQLSAAIVAGFANGHDLIGAVRLAKSFITKAIEHSLPIGHGYGPANPLAWGHRKPGKDA